MALATLAISLSPAGTAPAAPATAPTLTLACGREPGIVCRTVWDLTHNSHAADFVTAYLACLVQLVLRIAFVLVLAVLVRLASAAPDQAIDHARRSRARARRRSRR